MFKNRTSVFNSIETKCLENFHSVLNKEKHKKENVVSTQLFEAECIVTAVKTTQRYFLRFDQDICYYCIGC